MSVQIHIEKRQRRKDLEPEEVELMKKLVQEGKSRKEVALELRCSPSVITRRLGPTRKYVRKCAL